MSKSRGVVPFITPWSTEEVQPTVVIELGNAGIGYADETLGDRDEHGVLWRRMASRPGRGRPLFGQMHSLRQRKAMGKLLCGICAGPADVTGQGVLWLLQDNRDDWPAWPNGMAATEPPVCLPCAHLSVRVCPAIRNRYAAIRVGRCEVSGVYGIRYRGGAVFPTTARDDIVTFDDPAIRWTCAVQLVRHLTECTLIDLEV